MVNIMHFCVKFCYGNVGKLVAKFSLIFVKMLRWEMASTSNNSLVNTLQTAHPLELEILKSYSCPPFHFLSGCDQFY